MAAPSLACRGFGRPALLLSLAAAAVAPRPLTSSLSVALRAASLHTPRPRGPCRQPQPPAQQAAPRTRALQQPQKRACRRGASLLAMGSASLESAPSRPRVHDCQNACGQHMALPRPKKRGVQGRSGPYPNSMPTTFANSRPKMGRIWVITSGGVKHGPTGQLAEHLAPQALRWPTRWPTPDIFCFPHRYTGVLCTSAAIIHEGWFHPAGWLLYKVRIKRAVRAEHTYSGISCGALKHRDILRGGWTINHFVHVARPLVVS